MDRYFPFRSNDETPITVERVIRGGSVELHKHLFYEFVLVSRGSCVHTYDGSDVVLLPGDVFLLPPQESHAFRVDGDMSIYNLQFFPHRIGARWHGHVRQGEAPGGENDPSSINAPLKERWDDILRAVSLGRNVSTAGGQHGEILRRHADLNAQGIIHLDEGYRRKVEEMLEEIITEQTTQNIGFEFIKHAYLEIILVMLIRVQREQLPQPGENRTRKREIVAKALNRIEGNLMYPPEIETIAAESYVTPNYFRTVFKEITGLTPTNYINRLRITRALEHLRNGGMSVAEAAEAVGIADPNYFSRLFKKVVGHSPRRSIPSSFG